MMPNGLLDTLSEADTQDLLAYLVAPPPPPPSVLGHYTKTLEDPWFQILMLRGVAWAADQRIGRPPVTAIRAPET